MLQTFFKYLQYEKRYSPHTLTSYENDLRQFEKFCLNQYEIADLLKTEHRHIRAWIVHLMNLNTKTTSINRKVAALRTLFKFAVSRELVENNPTLKIQTLKTPKKIPQFVQESNLQKLFEQFEFPQTFEGSRDALILEILYGTGIRLSELLALKIEDVDLYTAQIKVLGKGNKERIIPLHNQLKQRIAAYQLQKKNEINTPKNDKLIVTNKGHPAYAMLVYRVVKKYLDLFTTIDKRSPHVLRHSFATHLLNKGADLNAVKDLLGHNSLAATQVYTHNSLEKLKTVFNQAHPKA